MDLVYGKKIKVTFPGKDLFWSKSFSGAGALMYVTVCGRNYGARMMKPIRMDDVLRYIIPGAH